MPIFVNEIEILDDEVHEEMQHHPSKNVSEARNKAAHALVIRKLLLIEAVKQNIISDLDVPSSSEEEEIIGVLIHNEVKFKTAQDENCLRYYENNNLKFIDKSTGELLPFELVHAHIRDYLETRSLQNGISHYLKLLAGKAKIVGFNLEGYDGPLVQ